jgi:hypothetical protein
LENEGSSAEYYQELMDNLTTYLSDTERAERGLRFDELPAATEMAMNIQEYSSIAVFSAVPQMMSSDSTSISLEQFQDQVITIRPQIRDSVRPVILGPFVQIYRELEEA